jgi:UDP-N-acetylmuramoylalanine--D-glutamate ligase
VAIVPAGSLKWDSDPSLAGGSEGPITWDGDGVLGELPARRVRFGEDPRAELSLREGWLCWLGEPLLAVAELSLRGRHNAQNAMAAAAVCLARGVAPEAVREGLRTFAGVPHRLQEVARRGGVLFVNDSKATNVASTLVALEAFADGEPPDDETGCKVHLILGGQGKGQDFSPLRGPAGKVCAGVYLIGEDAPALAAALTGAEVPVSECGDLEHAVARAAAAARPGEVVLLSPACASFDQFADYEARGERFRELVVGTRAAVSDPDGRAVELTVERWGHIVERHPEIQTLDQVVLDAVRSPAYRVGGRLANEEWYYVKTDVPSKWLKVVVAYAEGRGHIVTAYARRSMP